MWLALWIIQLDSQSTLRVSSSSSASLSVERAPPCIPPRFRCWRKHALDHEAISAYFEPMQGKSRKIAKANRPKAAESANFALTDVDRRILKVMQEDGRMTIQAIGERVGLSPSPCLRRIRRMVLVGFFSVFSFLLVLLV